MDIVFREAALRGRYFANGFTQRAFFRSATLADAGLVEMNMRLNKAREDQTAVELLLIVRLPREFRLQRSDSAAGNSDIARLAAACDARIAQNEVECHERTLTASPIRRRPADQPR